MQSFNFALRQSTTDSVDGNRRRFVPSSVYSGPGPAEEYPLPPQLPYAHHGYGGSRSSNGLNQNNVANGINGTNGTNGTNGVNGIWAAYPSTRSNSYAQPPKDHRLRTSTTLNVNDPVLMHLLAETALSDSKEFEIVSFDELEQLKRDRLVLRNRLDSVRRKIALECKLRDAAQSLNRLYTKTKGSIDNSDAESRGLDGNPAGSKISNNEALNRANDEFHSSSRRIEGLTHELELMEVKLQDTQRRIMEHTAGILQMTHRGLKRNVKKNDMPRSPESMTSPVPRGTARSNQLDDFDERSLYPVPDYVHEFTQSNPVTPILPAAEKFNEDSKVLEGVTISLQDLSKRVHEMVKQLNAQYIEPSPPEILQPLGKGNSPSEIELQLSHISDGLTALTVAQKRTLEETDNVKARIHKMIERTNSVSRSPVVAQGEPHGEDAASQLAFSSQVLEQLHQRVDNLVEQKDILTRQIQQQRELNTKSDAQRDAQIQDLTEELEESKRMQGMAEKESLESQNEISMLIDQLDRAKQDALLAEQQRGMNETKALQSERDARKVAENELLNDVEAKQQVNVQLQSDIAKMQSDFEIRSQEHIRQMNDISSAKEELSIEVQRHQAEADKVLGQMAALQTELTIVKAELDGAYGSRAQRAADVSLNPAVQKEIDSLNSKNTELQRELRETIEDYEQMTKASIEFEKERDRLESLIDSLRERGESLESQLSEEKLQWLGFKTQAPTETTSTMVLKNEFKKMMRDTRVENSKALKAEQEERRRLEALIRGLRKEAGSSTPAKSTISSHLSVEPSTPSRSRLS